MEKLSEYIKYLQSKLDRYGDGEVYTLGEFGEHNPPPSCECNWDEDRFYDYNESKDECIERVVKNNIRYCLH